MMTMTTSVPMPMNIAMVPLSYAARGLQFIDQLSDHHELPRGGRAKHGEAPPRARRPGRQHHPGRQHGPPGAPAAAAGRPARSLAYAPAVRVRAQDDTTATRPSGEAIRS
jgi:hypothetical protein